jgi:broad specificity phosphatase PhoE
MQLQPRTIFLARHAQSELNAARLISGQLDSALTPKGVERAAGLARVLRSERLGAIYTSALRRTVETARPISKMQRVSIYPNEELNEIDMGVLQGRPRDGSDPEALALWQEWQAQKGNARVPGGESFSDLEARVIPCVREIVQRTSERPALIIGHRSTNRVILGFLMCWAREQYIAIRVRSKYLYEVVFGGELRAPKISTIRLDLGHEGDRYAGFRE